MKLIILFTTLLLLFRIGNSSVVQRVVLSLNNKLVPSLTFDDKDINLREEVNFYLYTQKNKDKPNHLYLDDPNTLSNSYYNASLPTKLITHGWRANYTSDTCKLIRQALLAKHNFNVIVIDWASIANKKYIVASSRVRVIGNYTGKMIQLLLNKGTDPRSMSLVGHSFGAHIMGFAAKIVKPKVDHIVGLDAAGVGFEKQPPENRLSENDAEFVEVIHSSMGQAGISTFIGAADFYPNGGGPRQPGCPDERDIKCAHTRAYEYYAESIRRPEAWYGVLCNSYDDFENGKCLNNKISPFPRWSGAYRAERGKYMLRTSPNEPYGLGLDGTKPQN